MLIVEAGQRDKPAPALYQYSDKFLAEAAMQHNLCCDPVMGLTVMLLIHHQAFQDKHELQER